MDAIPHSHYDHPKKEKPKLICGVVYIKYADDILVAPEPLLQLLINLLRKFMCLANGQARWINNSKDYRKLWCCYRRRNCPI